MRISWLFLALLIGFFSASTADAADSAILGGIGTGKLEIRPDGRLAGFTYNHNPHQPIDDSTGCFAAISIVSENRMTVKRLYSDANDPEAVETVRIYPRFPFARVDYADAQLPVRVSLDAYSPFVPGSIESSCYPAVVFRYTVQNPASQEVAVTVAMSWRNWIGRGGTAQEIFDTTGVLSHRLLRRGNDAGILYQLNKANPTGAARNALGEQALIYRAQQKETAAVLPLWHPESEAIGLRLFMEKTEDYLKSKDAEFERPQADTSRPAAAIAARRTIPAGESRSFTFVLAWRMPYCIGKDDSDYGVYYATRWNSIQNILEELGKKNAALEEVMQAWETTYRSSSLPGWLFDRMRNGMSVLARDGVYFADGRFSMLSGNPDYPGNLGAPEERLADASFLLQCFPDLLRSELDLISQCQLADGEVPSALGNLYGAIGNGNVPGGFIGNPDSSSAYVLLAYQYYLWTGDRKFLDDHSQHLRYALRWLMARDRNADMIPDGPSLWPWAEEGVTSLFSGNLAMAAFRVGEELEQIYQDLEFQTWCRQQGQGIARNLGSQLWNGGYYNAFFDARFPTRPDGIEMIPGLLGGEWFALHQGWKSLLPPARITSTIQSMAMVLSSSGKSRSINMETAWRYGYAPAFAGTALLRYGFFDAASRLISPPASIPEAGWWSYAAALSGFGLDLHRRCLVVGPVLPSASETFACPFSSSLYSGEILYNRSRLSGQQECDIQFDRLPGGKDASLLQIAFAFPQSSDANESAMQVYHNGQSVAGQDFSRESLRVFGFQPALRLKAGDRLSLLLAPKEGARVIVDVQSREIRNFGGKCRIEKTGLTISGVSFYISNLLPGKQWLSLDLRNPAPQQEYAVFLNGQKQSFSIPSPEPIPLVLPQSPISAENLAFLQTIVKACQDTAVRFASVSGREELKKKLWSLQEEANRLIDLDTGQRGMRFDIIPMTVLDQFKLQETEKSDRPFQDDLQRLRENGNTFMADIQKQSNDPILASELTGYFVPLAIQASVDEIVTASRAFALDIRTRNPLRSPLTGRIHLDLPEQWRAIAGADVVFDDRQDAEEERRLAFSIFPNADLWQKRFPMQVNVSGTWNEFPYRKSQSVYVGHEFIKRWMIVGPFPNERGEGFSRMIPPENNIQLQETYPGIGGDVGWKEYEFPDGYVNLDAVLTPNDNAVAYAYTSLYSPREQAVQVRVGCNGDLKLFLNYKESFAKRNVNRPQPGSETFPIRLFEGWNHLVVKLSERTGPWGFYFEVYDLQGKPIEGIQFALDKAE